ncbi:unnamed protein product [Clonostachys rhizophaga]|uniref:Putative gamma-glutamylcyclotransferase n=1 Tax=Clonostachys rhizophaga TaxID=160324 RepID=A0A9N9W5Z5_9HYPO|nr:unnamed protein product [Clonostachys rhizophaga]
MIFGPYCAPTSIAVQIMESTAEEKDVLPQESAANLTPVFVYGTLCAVPLLAWALMGDASQTDAVKKLIRPARVEGFARYGIKSCDYPAAVKCDGSEIRGYLVTFTNSSQRKKLDDFEGEIYSPTHLTAQVLNQNGEPSSQCVDAEIYLWNGSLENLTMEPWDLEGFIEERLEDWLDLFDGMELVG